MASDFTEERIRGIVRDELRIILDKGLMYTAPGPVKPAADEKKWTWNPDKIKWTEDVGKKGPYEKSEDVNNEFKAMAKDLQEHQGKLTRDGRFYWLFTDGKAVGRTLAK